MDLELSETQSLIQKSARDFAKRVIEPQAKEIDRTEKFPKEILKGLADLGLMAVNVSDSLGGSEAGVVAYALAIEEVSRACASTAVTMAVTNMVCEVIASFGSDAQKQKYCPKLASGEYAAGAFALSESGAGSDPGGMSTAARLEGDHWVIDGSKQWITSGAYAGVFVVWARTASKESHPGARGLSCFLVEGGTPGLKVGRAEDKMGLRGSNTVSLSFEECRVPREALLGAENSGFKIAMAALDGGRIGVSAQAIGIASAALDASVAYAKDRKQFEKTLGEFQATQWKLADMKTDLDAARLLCLRAATMKERGQPFSKEASMSKVFASEMCNRAVNKAVQIHGGYGYTREFAVERYLRDARVTMIYEGTSEVQRVVIARSVLG